MQTTIENVPPGFALVGESFELTMRLANGDFDDDPDARALAVAFLEVARPFCDELLKAWPEFIAMRPLSEV